MSRKARIFRVIPMIGVGATLTLSAASATGNPLQSDPSKPQAAPSTFSSHASCYLREGGAQSGDRDSRPDERDHGPPLAGRKLKRIRYVAPQYPTRALNAGVSGYVTLEFIVNAEGQPSGLKLIDAQPEGLFDRAALSAVKRWRYQPLRINGAPVEIPTRQLIHFELTRKARR